MPLPRPIGDPFTVKEEDDSASTPSRRPISASAFSFNVGPKSTPSGTKWRPMTSMIAVKEEMKERSDRTPIRRDGHEAEGTPLREMTPMKKLDSLPSFIFNTPATDRKRVNDSPFAQPTKRKTEDEKPMVPLNTAGVDLGEGIYIENVKRRVEEEGIGVSPRGKKIIKYHGRGPIPLSFILNNALNSQQSSLVLFYASLQNTLYPTRTPKKSRMTPSALTIGLHPKAPTLLKHIKTAPVILKPAGVVVGRTGWSTMCYCEIKKGSLDQAVLGKKVIQKDADGMEKVLVVFQPVPAECAKLGLDPRVITLKPTGKYEIGLWGPWSTSTSPGGNEGEDRGNESEVEERGTTEGEPIEGVRKMSTVVFASRYLIAEI